LCGTLDGRERGAQVVRDVLYGLVLVARLLVEGYLRAAQGDVGAVQLDAAPGDFSL
jgi:hypothetical protein